MHALSLHGLKKTYRNGHQALQGIDLEVSQGDFFALLGANGAGKSTAIGIIAGLVKKSEGQIRVFGHDVDREPFAARRCIGLVPQEINFNQFERVEDIVMNQAGFYGLPYRHAKARTELCLKLLQLWDKRKTTSRTLSGGMKRRLMIARALVHQPRMLILDEPTAGVDIEIRRSLWALLREINQAGTTIILTTHYLEEAEHLCRHLAIIDGGRIVQHSTLSAMLGQLQQETWLLDIDSSPDHTLPSPPQLEHYRITLEDGGDSWCVRTTAEHGIHPLLLQLAELGITVKSLRPASNRLEQLLLQTSHGATP